MSEHTIDSATNSKPKPAVAAKGARKEGHGGEESVPGPAALTPEERTARAKKAGSSQTLTVAQKGAQGGCGSRSQAQESKSSAIREAETGLVRRPSRQEAKRRCSC